MIQSIEVNVAPRSGQARLVPGPLVLAAGFPPGLSTLVRAIAREAPPGIVAGPRSEADTTTDTTEVTARRRGRGGPGTDPQHSEGAIRPLVIRRRLRFHLEMV